MAHASDPWSDTPSLDDRIVAALARVASVMRSDRWAAAAGLGLNPAQAEALELLAQRRAGVRLSWLAEQLGVSTASASDSVASLVEKGLVLKRPALDDRRAVALRLSAAGRAMAHRLADAASIAKAGAAALTAQGRERLYAELLAMTGAMQQHPGFPALRACATCQYFQVDRHRGSSAPHHCALVDAPLPTAMLRLDCAEHEAAESGVAARNWRLLQRA